MNSFIGFIFFVFTTAALAQDVKSDGNSWHQICNGGEASGKLICKSFIAGFVSGVSMQADFFKTRKLFCFPKEAVTSQAADVFSIYLARHPENRHLDSTTLASIAMIEAFPCPK